MAKWAQQLIGFLKPASAAITLLIGGWWMLTPIILLLGLYPFLDTLAGSSTVHDVEEEGRGHNVIVHLHGILVPIVVLCLLYRVWDGLGAVSSLFLLSLQVLPRVLLESLQPMNLDIEDLVLRVGG